jgi:hypothetical protein
VLFLRQIERPDNEWYSLELQSLDPALVEDVERAVDSIFGATAVETGIEFERAPKSLVPGGQIPGLKHSDLVQPSAAIALFSAHSRVGPLGSSNMNIAIAGGTPAFGLGETGAESGECLGMWASIPTMMRTAEHVSLLAMTIGGMTGS